MPVLSFPLWAWPVWAGCAVLTAWSGWRALRDRPVVFRQLVVAAVVEVVLLVQAVLAVVAVARGRSLVEPAVFWGYVVVAMLLLPAGAVVAVAERTRWSSVVLVVVALALAVVEVRMLSLWWAGAGA